MTINFFTTGSEAVATPPLVYTSQITQSGLDAPTEVVLENTLGLTLTWSRWSIGTFRATISPAVDWSKTSFFMGNQLKLNTASSLVNTIQRSSTEIEIEGMELLTGVQFDDYFHNTLLEIKTYDI